MSALSFTVQTLYYSACPASLFDTHVCAFSRNTFSFCAWLQIEPWGNRLKGSTKGRKLSHNIAGKVKVGGVGCSQFYYQWKDVGENFVFKAISIWITSANWVTGCIPVRWVTELHPTKSHSVIMKDCGWGKEKSLGLGRFYVLRGVLSFGKAWSAVCTEKF